VDDLIDGFYHFMQTDRNVTVPLNLGSGTEITIRELAETIIEMTGSSSRLVFEPLPEDDPRQRMPDITLAGELLDWIPVTTLEDGLRETINYFQKRVA